MVVLVLLWRGKTGGSAAGDDGCAYRSGRTFVPENRGAAPPWYRSSALRAAGVYHLPWAVIGRRHVRGMPWLQRTRLPAFSWFPAPDSSGA